MIIFVFLFFVLMVYTPVSANAACIDPFVGERLDYEMGWEFIMAGTTTLRVASDANHQHHQYITAQTNKLFDVFKKVRDQITGSGYCDQQGKWRSTRFHVKQQERRYQAEKLTVFSSDGQIVHYTQNSKTDDYPVTPNHLQVLDAFYKARTMTMALGSTFSIPVFDSRKSYNLVIQVQQKTVKIIAPWGKTVECIVVIPLLKTAGVFSSKGKIKIWMTHDARHIPLKMSAKIKIGRIMGYLTHYQAP